MRCALLAVAVAGAGCQAGTEVPAVPWMHGLSGTVASDQGNDSVARRLEQYNPGETEDCAAAAYPGIELHADVAGSRGTETILASYAQGIVVLDSERRVVASTPGYRCGGSADEIDAIVAGDAFGARTLVVVGTTGGHRESATWLGVFRVGFDRRLDPAFTGVIEEHDGDRVSRGSLYFLPGALLYRHPRDERPAVWFWNPIARAYLLPGNPVDDSHDDGPRDQALPQT